MLVVPIMVKMHDVLVTNETILNIIIFREPP